MRKCTKCFTEKPDSEFSKGCWECRACAVKRASLWQKENIERHRTKNQEWRARHPKRYLIENAKRHSKRDGKECTICETDFEIPTHCPILGIELKKGNNGKPIYSSPSLDRLDPTKGYIPGNVIVMSWRANTLRKDGTIDEFKAIIAWLEQTFVPKSDVGTSQTGE